MNSLSKTKLSNLKIEQQNIYNEYFDPHFTTSIAKNVFALIDECYFRSKFVGFDNFPERNNPKRPLIFVSNHSGMTFPWDGIIFIAGLFRKYNYDLSRFLRALAEPILSKFTLMSPFLIENFWKRGGGVDATFSNFEAMMHHNESNILVYPEGAPGMGKGFQKRYVLQRFATSFVRLSLKYRTDIIPFSTVNGEYISPYTYHSNAINRIVNKFGIPFLPIGPITLFLVLQPWMIYFAFPAKLAFVMGKRVKTYEMIDKPFEEITQEEIHNLAETVKKQMQEELDEAVKKYGNKPYAAKEFFTVCLKNARKFPFFMPFFWPSIFTEFERLYQKGGKSAARLGFVSVVRAFLKSPILLAFFLPILGWIPILIRGLRQRKKN